MVQTWNTLSWRGPGMVLMCQPVMEAVAAIEKQSDVPATRILLAPTGKTLTQPLAEELSRLPRLLLIAGHYEGFDQRIQERDTVFMGQVEDVRIEELEHDDAHLLIASAAELRHHAKPVFVL